MEWLEETERALFTTEYVPVGALPGIARPLVNTEDETLRRLLSQTLILTAKRSQVPAASSHSRFVGEQLAKLLQRGHIPLPTLGIEAASLESNGLSGIARDHAGDQGGSDVGWELPRRDMPQGVEEQVIATISTRHPFVLDSEFVDANDDALITSATEIRFLTEWVPSNLGAQAAHWITPQASLDTILEANGGERSGYRRVDFLMAHPDGEAFVVELDGPEHADSVEADAQRDKELQAIGIDVIRVPNHEVLNGRGPALTQVEQRWSGTIKISNGGTDAARAIARAILDGSLASKFQMVIARALAGGFLVADEWSIHVTGGSDVTVAAMRDALELLSAYDTLFGGTCTPARCTVTLAQGHSVTWERSDDDWLETDGPATQGSTISVCLDEHASPFHEMPSDHDYDFVVRPAFLPVDLALARSRRLSRQTTVELAPSEAEQALTVFLQHVFRKRRFRPQQAEAIQRSLRHQDLLVLLPTGFGKSLIYQLAGLLLPGITLVVDPLVALIEDQVEGLRRQGIERVTGISGASGHWSRRAHLMQQMSRGAFFFVLIAPERLQTPDFRQELDLLQSTSFINLAVIDEAHCVSEWGHEFRPSYLRLADNLRTHGRDRDDTPPPILGLTGTASRAVLKDMMADLEIGQTDSTSVIRPDSFDRPELKFKIEPVTDGRETENALKKTLRALPEMLYPANPPPSGLFYRPNGSATHSGIIFTRTKRGRGGVDTVADLVREEIDVRPGTYAGDPTAQQVEDARSFKENATAVLVATKAFGMGIDKPNIRWIVHYGMPGSLESYYQEAGRAGRDHQTALCVIAFTEYDRARTEQLLDQNSSLDELRKRFEDTQLSRGTRDDVTSALYFHNESFPDRDLAVKDVESLLQDTIGDLSQRRDVEVTWNPDERTDRQRIEHAIIRLMRIGAVQDYEVDFGKHHFRLDISPFSLERSKTLLLNYIRLAQPQLTLEFSRRLDAVRHVSPTADALRLAELLIDFTYNVIERARRRAIWEAISLARTAQDDREFRRRLLDYLQGGIGSERISALLDNPTPSLGEWLPMIQEVQTPVDAGELRGICARALESYPEHPGLLFVRGAVETMCSDFDWRASKDNFVAAVRQAQRLLVPMESLIEFVAALFDLADAGRADKIASSLTYALTVGLADAGGSLQDSLPLRDVSRSRARKSRDCKLILDVYDVIRATSAGTQALAALEESLQGFVGNNTVEVRTS